LQLIKKYLFIVLLVFFWSCEEIVETNTIINHNDGVQLKWIGLRGINGNNWIYYKGELPPSNSLGSGSWVFIYECVEIELFQSEGYFNYRDVYADSSSWQVEEISDWSNWRWVED
tara:strand:+ start:194 stop:538 length:345 start_codon:yes stop_codon:yes gene_type:complete